MIDYSKEEERKKFYRSKRWAKIRAEILIRDNHECQDCKAAGRITLDSKKEKGVKKKPTLNVDHILELEDNPELAEEPKNLRTLCIRCHNQKHGRYISNLPKWPDEWF